MHSITNFIHYMIKEVKRKSQKKYKFQTLMSSLYSFGIENLDLGLAFCCTPKKIPESRILDLMGCELAGAIE